MKKTMYLLVLLLPVFTACTQQVQSESIRFFYSQKCASCQQMKGFLEELMELNADLSMTMTDIDEESRGLGGRLSTGGDSGLGGSAYVYWRSDLCGIQSGGR